MDLEVYKQWVELTDKDDPNRIIGKLEIEI